jgi:hypothetical protein
MSENEPETMQAAPGPAADPAPVELAPDPMIVETEIKASQPPPDDGVIFHVPLSDDE